jgi:putative membrane protein
MAPSTTLYRPLTKAGAISAKGWHRRWWRLSFGRCAWRSPTPQRKGWRVAEQPVDAATRLAVQRTRLAQERTLMAWIRTSTSLIAFGFTIFKFFEYLATNERRREPILSPWVLGMIMILLGLAGLALAWIQHRQEMKALRAEVGPMPYSIAGIMAVFIAGLGAIALILVAFRM